MNTYIVILVITVLMMTLSILPALADDKIILTRGSLVVAGKPTGFAGFAIQGETYLSVVGITALWTADDARGNGAGWYMTVAAHDFASGAYLIPKGTL